MSANTRPQIKRKKERGHGKALKRSLIQQLLREKSALNDHLAKKKTTIKQMSRPSELSNIRSDSFVFSDNHSAGENNMSR